MWSLTLPAAGAWLTALTLLALPPLIATLTAPACATLAVLAWLLTRPSSPHPPGLTPHVRHAAPRRPLTRHRKPPLPTIPLRHRRPLTALLSAMAATAAVVALTLHSTTTGPIPALAAQGATITAEVTLTDDPKARKSPTSRESIVAQARIDAIHHQGTRTTLSTPVVLFANGPQWGPLLPSQRLQVTGRLTPAAPGDLVAAFLLVRGPPRILTRPTWIHTAAGDLRAGLRDAAAVLPPDQRGLLPGLVVGDVSRMDPQVAADFRDAGLTHLLAVSGANLAIVAGAVLALARLAGFPLPARALLASAAMLAFAVVARPSPSVLRALVMGLVAMLTLGTGRARDGFTALSAAVLLLILFDPGLARSYGFALSVCATAGLLLLAPRLSNALAGGPATHHPTPLRDRLRNLKTRHVTFLRSATTRRASPPLNLTAWRAKLHRSLPPTDTPDHPSATHPHRQPSTGRRRLPHWIAEALAIPIAAQAAVTPVLVLMAGQLTLIAIPANLLAAPAVAPATLLGFAAAVVAPLSPEAAELLVIPAGYAVAWIIAVAEWAASMPLTEIPWPGGLPGLALLAVVVAIAVPLLRSGRWRPLIAVIVCAVLLAVLAVRPMVASWPPPRWLLVACDVGQGDGLVIAAGPGRGVVVDTGPDPILMDRCLRDLGVREVPLLVLTHPHADHVAGTSGVLRGRPVGAVLLSPVTEEHPRAEREPVPPIPDQGPQTPKPARWVATPGSRWTFGPSEVTVLGPPTGSPASEGPGEGSAVNNASIVLHVRWSAGSALLSGDIETEAQTALVRHGLPSVDVLKVPHHGSARQDPAFLAATGARAALISVGADNLYGHPAPFTLAALHRLGTRIYRTDQAGHLVVLERDGRLAVGGSE
ncbi:ComEC/Rec2 family competence protein [Nonomuraea soli]|uniref:Competence protein ComEC n=1 Tax=Nonomuraea soli TaxID=1032476 RepID=A0A7W0CDA2_9ACTN|nr:ComEC/Rec2 family competence protein [Nonomuraea soli]MBA2889039.1 competence protein ComEC [Nonomuraea soli]